MFRVNTDGLNLRVQPNASRSSDIIAVLHRGDLVEKVSEPRDGWWQVHATVVGQAVDGFVASRFLVPDGEYVAHAGYRGVIPAVQMPEAKGARDLDGFRAYPLGEADQPGRNGGTPPAKVGQLLEIVTFLDVEHSVRYRPNANTTYCNIYAYDFCYLAGVYLPRVWWTDSAIHELARQEQVGPAYDVTIREMNANSLHDWLSDWGTRFGWARTLSLSDLQDAANAGEVALICARRKDRNRSGHICAVVPETDVSRAGRTNGAVVRPLQSQAGTNNHAFWNHVWWSQRSQPMFDAVGFWHTDQTLPAVEA